MKKKLVSTLGQIYQKLPIVFAITICVMAVFLYSQPLAQSADDVAPPPVAQVVQVSVPGGVAVANIPPIPEVAVFHVNTNIGGGSTTPSVTIERELVDLNQGAGVTDSLIVDTASPTPNLIIYPPFLYANAESTHDGTQIHHVAYLQPSSSGFYGLNMFSIIHLEVNGRNVTKTKIPLVTSTSRYAMALDLTTARVKNTAVPRGYTDVPAVAVFLRDNTINGGDEFYLATRNLQKVWEVKRVHTTLVANRPAVVGVVPEYSSTTPHYTNGVRINYIDPNGTMKSSPIAVDISLPSFPKIGSPTVTRRNQGTLPFMPGSISKGLNVGTSVLTVSDWTNNNSYFQQEFQGTWWAPLRVGPGVDLDVEELIDAQHAPSLMLSHKRTSSTDTFDVNFLVTPVISLPVSSFTLTGKNCGPNGAVTVGIPGLGGVPHFAVAYTEQQNIGNRDLVINHMMGGNVVSTTLADTVTTSTIDMNAIKILNIDHLNW